MGVFICVSEQSHSVLAQWFIRASNSDNISKLIVRREKRELIQLTVDKFAKHIISGDSSCSTFMTALTPVARMVLSIIQMQFIFLNTTDLDMGRHKVISRFGLMHMVATNLCEWLYVLVEETKHEIHHLRHAEIATNYRMFQSIYNNNNNQFMLISRIEI